MCVFCLKHKTAYEMRISDWSSDVCSSDLHEEHRATDQSGGPQCEICIALPQYPEHAALSVRLWPQLYELFLFAGDARQSEDPPRRDTDGERYRDEQRRA